MTFFQWDGKTIALGTFSVEEAADKCTRAKALTKKWRTTMVPKPSAEWVKSTLERLNIRVVNDRPGRRKKRDINEAQGSSGATSSAIPTKSRKKEKAKPLPQNVIGSASQIPFQGADRDFSSFGDVSASHSLQRRLSDHSQYTGGPGSQMMGMSNRFASMPSNSYPANNPISMHDNRQENLMPRNNVNFDEAMRMGRGSQSTQNQLANLSFGSTQHYQVLKEHHSNLLRELQQTTTLMNMYHNNNPMQNMQRRDNNMDPYLDQSLLSNQLYPPSMPPRRDSFGVHSSMQGSGMLQQQGQIPFSSPFGGNQHSTMLSNDNMNTSSSTKGTMNKRGKK